MLHRNVITLSLVLSSLLSAGQIGYPISKIYDVNFDNSTAIWSIVQDQRGIMYLATGRGIYEYDGVQFRSISTIAAYGLAIDETGEIYVSAKNDFGILRSNPFGEVYFQSLITRLPDSLKIGVANNVAITKSKVYCISSTYTLEYDKNTKQVVPYQPHAGSGFYNGYVNDDKIWISITGKGLYNLQNGKTQMAPYGDYFSNLHRGGMNSILTFANDNRVLLFSPHMIRYFGSSKPPVPFHLKNYDQSKQILYNSFSLTSNYHLVTSINRGAILFDTLGNVLNHYSDSTQFPGNNFVYATKDFNDNIWLTLENYKRSVIKTEHGQDISQWKRSIGIKGGIYSIIQYNGRMYIATDQNLYQVRKDNQVLPLFNEPISVKCLTKFPMGGREQLLAVVEGRNLVSVQGSKLTPLYQGYSISDILVSKVYPDRLYVADQNKFGYLVYENNEWVYHSVISLFEDTYLTEDSEGSIWLSNDQRSTLIRIQFDSERSKGKTRIQGFYQNAGMPDRYCIPLIFENKVLFATMNDVYEFNQASLKFQRWKSASNTLYELISRSSLITKDPFREMYHLVSNQELISLDIRKKEKPIIAYKPYRRSDDLGSIRHVLVDNVGALWWSGVDGVVRYDRSKDFKNYDQAFKCLIRSITLHGDSTWFQGGLHEGELEDKKLSIPFNQGQIAFQYAAPFFDREEKTLYSYVLEGSTTDWSEWATTTSREFDNLPEGNYSLRVKARNIYGTESSQAVFSFVVTPPWFRTWWAYTIYVFIAISGILLLVRFRTYSLRRKKRDLERQVRVKTKELILSNEELKQSEAKLRQMINDLQLSQNKLSRNNEELQTLNNYLKIAQRQLVDSEKMASLGQLTAGIAHEINNPINFISGGVQALSQVHQNLLQRHSVSADELEIIRQEIEDLMSSINNGVVRTTSIVKGLRVFSSPSEKIDLEGRVDVKECIENSLVLVKSKLMEHQVEVETDFAHRSGCKANSPQISQVLINLLDNSIYALRQIQGLRKIAIRTFESESEVFIKVHDNGSGIPPEIMEHIFEPFFTSKEVGIGTGLGLSICYSIIQRHNGSISVNSTPSQGTEFSISLPKGELL